SQGTQDPDGTRADPHGDRRGSGRTPEPDGLCRGVPEPSIGRRGWSGQCHHDHLQLEVLRSTEVPDSDRTHPRSRRRGHERKGLRGVTPRGSDRHRPGGHRRDECRRCRRPETGSRVPRRAQEARDDGDRARAGAGRGGLPDAGEEARVPEIRSPVDEVSDGAGAGRRTIGGSGVHTHMRGQRGTALVTNAGGWGAGLCLAGIVVAGALQVFWRYALNAPLSWPEEVSRLLLIWLTYIGALVAPQSRLHV